MDIIVIIKSIILGIVQGITEWLPISSTGHLILAGDIMKFDMSTAFGETFKVVIQLGSILAVIVLYFKKLNPIDPSKSKVQQKETLTLWTKIVAASVPAGVMGFLLDDLIEAALSNATTIAITLIGYGIVLIVIENWNRKPRITELSQISYKTAIGIGLFQVLALIPGTSRSGSTIIGATILGTSRYIAAEFSFFLALPVMLGASAYKMLKSGMNFNSTEWAALGTASLVSFVVSVIAIKFLIDYIKKHDFKIFGYYRIVVGVIILAYFYL